MITNPRITGSALNYAGDILPEEAWTLLKDRKDAQLLDVRAQAEWQFVGVPDLSTLGKAPLLIELQSFPDMSPNPQFVEQALAALKKSGANPDAPVLCICRSGARSRHAAIALTAAGFKSVFNVAHGFEGDLSTDRHRGQQNGWKKTGLPWIQT